jgi:hypothetical protein
VAAGLAGIFEQGDKDHVMLKFLTEIVFTQDQGLDPKHLLLL